MKFRRAQILFSVFPSLVWKIDDQGKTIFLTFDDGPEPDVTPFVLDTLLKYKAKATFFCIGKNAEKHPFIYHRILAEGHSVGNHTYDHLNGWKTNDSEYLENVEQCQTVFRSDMFRPPYGRISFSQFRKLKKKYKIVMWDVLTRDYDTISPEQCLKRTLSLTRKGSVVVFHDSLKASDNMRYTLPKMLDHFSGLGYEFKSIS